MLHWALTAVALLLFLYAVRTVFSSSKAEESGKQKLGCGFAIVATALWVYVLNHYLESPWPAIRIGLGILLLLPAVEAVAKPEGAKLLRAGASLFVAVFLAGPPLSALWEDLGPDGRSSEERELADLVGELEDVRGELDERRAALATRSSELRSELFKNGRTWEELEADEALLEQLQVLVNVEEALQQTEGDLAKVDARLPLLREALAAAQAGEEATPEEEDEVEALLRSLEKTPSLEELSLVEQEARKMELQAFFEEER